MMRRTQQHHHQNQDQQSMVFYKLSALVLSILRSPPSPMQYTDQSPTETTTTTTTTSRTPAAQITPAGFAALMLGISLALMLCGSVTFFIGFMLMPWVLGLVMMFYVACVVSAISVLGKSIFSYAMSTPSSPRKDIPAWKLL